MVVSARSDPETNELSYSKSIKESGASMAARALREFTKSSPTTLQLDSVPAELLFSDDINFSRWTMILDDKSLKTLSEQANSGRRFVLDSSSPAVSGMFHKFWNPSVLPLGLLRLNITGAKTISDYGLTVVARNSPNLTTLTMNGCSTITDVGMREVGISCTKLQELNMSSCHGIEGQGLVAIAECCHYLIKFDISKCRSVKGWSLSKIFYSCTRLEEVNVSHLKEAGDDVIRVLAQNCSNIVSLIAVECCYISDTSILILAQHCTDLDYLDLSRTQMVFRITDTSLLALSQHCPSLKILKLNGCENVTDVGLSWLAEGCKVIEELDIGRCTKVSDAGLRSLGGSCHSLKSLDISHTKLVTDVGISSLSHGCPKLRILNSHGVFMLSDPRLSLPTKGAKLEAWQSLIGIAALAFNCSMLEDLDLSGCFRLNIALHQYVSTMTTLKRLNLTSCNQITSESLEEVAKGCSNLEEIVLTDCGKGVNSKAVTAFSIYCKNMRIVVVSRCPQINGAAIKAIANFTNLEKLDVSGCRALTDNMLLHLCDASKVQNLRTINFSDLPAITDSILAWVAMRTHKILLLAMKGTAISKKAIMSVRDRFPNSDVLQNENFYGFWPKFRVDDRILLNNYHRFIDGMIRLQARLRSHMARIRVAGIVQERIVHAAHFLLHRIARGFIGRRRFYWKKMKAEKLDRQARLIANLFRIPVAKKKVMRKRRDRAEHARLRSLVRLQQRWRIFSSKKRLQEKRDNFHKYWMKKIFCATKIQSIARLHFAVVRIRRIKAMIRGREDFINRKALMIQMRFRIYQAHCKVHRLRTYFARLKAEKLTAVVKIQQKFRVYRTQKILTVIQDARRHRLASAIKIQAVMRGALARLYVAELVSERNEGKLHIAATKIQSILRMGLAKKIVHAKRAKKMIQMIGYINASRTIVNQCRIKLACMRMKRRRSEYYQSVREQAEREIKAATKIQSVQRGIVGRSLFNEKLREKKGKWKELFDEQSGKRFFYNKLSGEIRWRIPQDLIDIIPRAPCDNCNYYEATVECAVCDEMFCGQCWESVHYGGRRRDHEFRSLYDYYGRRMDYGDGVFPCKWPTEVIQDEIQGWMLRVAPLRKPLATYKSGWEEYEDDTIKDKHNYNAKVSQTEPRSFYFHRSTFEARYEMPPEVQQEKDLAAIKEANAQQLGGYYDENKNWVPTNVYIESYLNSDADFNVIPYQTPGRLAASTAGLVDSSRRSGLTPSQSFRDKLPSGRLTGRNDTNFHETGRFSTSQSHNQLDSNVKRELFKGNSANKTSARK